MGRSAGRNPEERPDAAALTALTRQEQLELRLGYGFANPALLTQALTHRSLGTPHNERLEFLGDALLDTVISEELYQRFPEVSEGWMTQIRSRLVREGALAKIAGRLRLSECLRVGKSMQKGGGAAHEALLADALESVIAAIFLDNGHDYAGLCAVVLPWFAEEIAAISPEMPTEDAKSALQEFLQARQWWMLYKGKYVPVTIEAAKKSVNIYDRSKQQAPHVDFTVTLALEG